MKQTAISQFVYHKRCLRKEDAENLKEAEAVFVIAGLHSYTSLENIGIQQLAQNLIRIGSVYGNIDIGDIWYGRNTIREFTVKTFNDFMTMKETISAAV